MNSKVFRVIGPVSSLSDIISKIPEGTEIVICQEKNLKSLEGVELFPKSVTTLDVSDNELTSLKGIEKSEILDLDVSGNQLVSLDGIQGTKVKILDISDNKIDCLDGIEESEVEELHAHFNKISWLGQFYETKVVKLYICGNPCWEDFRERFECNVQKVKEYYTSEFLESDESEEETKEEFEERSN